MTHKRTSSQDLTDVAASTLVERYRAEAIDRGHALLRNDAKAANRSFDMLAAIADELTRRGLLADLQPLLRDDDPGVRLSAAGKLLRDSRGPCMNVLEELSHMDNLIGMSAAAILEADRRSAKLNG